MKTIVYAHAVAVDTNGDILDAKMSRNLNVDTGFSFGDYLNESLVDVGVTGGVVSIVWDDRDGLLIQTSFVSPDALSDQQRRALEAETRGQLLDGIGEDGFDLGGVTVRFDEARDRLWSRQLDDGAFVAPASRVAIAARHGDTKALSRALELHDEIDARLQGLTGLHLALLYGRAEAARMLMAAGANPNAITLEGRNALHLCAMSNDLDDTASCQLAQQLIGLGADPRLVDDEGQDAAFYAKIRKKDTLHEFLLRARVTSGGNPDHPETLTTPPSETLTTPPSKGKP